MYWCKGLTMAAVFTASAAAPGADLPPHEDLLGKPFADLVSPTANERAVSEVVTVTGQPFARALRVINRQRMERFYDFQVMLRIDQEVRSGDLLLLQFSARGEAPANETGEAEVQAYFQTNAPPHDKDLDRRLTVGSEWRTFNYPFAVRKDRPAGGTALCFGTGFNLQTLDIAEVRLLRFPPTVNRRDLPRTPAAYPGMAADAPWRAAAEARIREHRMGDLTVSVVDGAGRPVPQARVTVAMRRHAFLFSSIISVRRLLRNDADGEMYRAKLLELFNASGNENALKWPPWDGAWGPDWSREQTIAALRWLKDQGLYVRGHVMVWPGWRNLPKSIQDLRETNPDAIPGRVLEHIREIGAATRDVVDEWDVLNEPRTNHDLMDLFGRGIMLDWFRCAREVVPGKDLYINDFGILNGGGPGTSVHEAYKDTIRFLLDNGAPVDGIGLQGHIGSTLRDPAQVFRTLDDFSGFGLKIKVTEFDIDIDDEVAQANYTRDFMTVLFSHPAVVGFQMWGFWEGSHWKPNGAMYRRNWEEKPNGAAYRDLVFNRGWTLEETVTDAQGRATVRGFLGDYRITATHGGLQAEAATVITRDGATAVVTLQP